MKSVNKVILVGFAGKDPEVKYTPSVIPVGRFSLATNERFKDKDGKFQDRTEWHSIVAWQKLAEIVGEFMSKGSQIYVEGKLQTTSWKDRQSGEKKYRTEIVARDLVLLGSRDRSANGAQPSGSEKPEKDKKTAPAITRPSDISDEDVPF